MSVQAFAGSSRPIPKGRVFGGSYTAGANLFANNIAPTGPPCYIRGEFAFSVAGILTLVRTLNGVTVTEAQFQGAELVAGAAYIFDAIVWGPGEQLNWQYSANATPLVELIEIDVP